MDATGWVAVAGIAGTLLAAILSPMIAERYRATHAREEQLRTARIALYADCLITTGRLADNALTWASTPTANPEETPPAEQERVWTQVRVVGGKQVRSALEEIRKLTYSLFPLLDAARTTVARLPPEHADSDAAIRQRMKLTDIAVSIRSSHNSLEEAIHRELGV